MKVELINGIAEVSASVWNALVGTDYPFWRHEFLLALEASGSVSDKTGWEPQHLLLWEDEKTLAGALPLYRKFHSRGEYVFDHDWAHAYQRYGLVYYPKWLTAVPFTPCGGNRILVKPGLDEDLVFSQLFDYMQEACDEYKISSWHCLFPTKSQADYLEQKGFLIRQGVQFQWFNRGYSSFDDYIQTFNSKKRKNIKRERRYVEENDIELWQVPGAEVSESQWRAFFEFYQVTYMKRGMRPYLNLEFFHQIAETMPEQLFLVLAVKDDRYVGAALSLIGSDTLFGRYWGCLEEYNGLHFEACYYQGLEYCIKHGLGKFDSGAQGEHKIARGFEPTHTYSAHWVRDPQFRSAIADFLQREKEHIDLYKADAEAYLPFKKG